MLSWALRYLVMAVVAAVGFAALQGSDWLDPASYERSKTRSAAGRPAGEATERQVGTAEDSPSEDGAEPSDESDEGWAGDEGWGDDSRTSDDVWATDDSWDADAEAPDNAWATDDASQADAEEPEDTWGADDAWEDDGAMLEDGGAAGSTDGYLEMVIRAGPHGHFVVDAEVDGTPLSFLIDTGASDIVLSQNDARRLGLEPRTLDYSRTYQTANGVVRAAPVQLRELRLGQLQLYELDASVNERPLPMSLLGMSFLRRLQGYEVADGRLILRW
jgi:clan AA aspartic protease (TIGR02281 family)